MFIIVKLRTIFVCSRLEKIYGISFSKMKITLTLCGFNPINILAMVYIMYFILFQCIRMVESEEILFLWLFVKL